ncbi:hypothetical protein V6N13_012591 [Hibiscus sabdariffa]|uniref:Uncharacterized protein n=1 Tax=Hibiscus sabdariffa TaxID=183260 RepID=A0ABR2SFV7_9ROSI
MSSHVQVLPGMAREFSCNRFFMRMELYQTWDHLDTSSHMLKAQVLLGVTSWFNSSCPPHLSDMYILCPHFAWFFDLNYLERNTSESLREGRYLNGEKKDLFGSAFLVEVAVTPSSPFPFLLQLKFESLREGRYLNCEKKDLFGSAILN